MDSRDEVIEYDDAPPPGALTTAPQRAGHVARQDFGGSSLALTSASTEALIAKARADTEARWIMAMRRPRNLDEVRVNILQECRRPGFAEVAIYKRPAGRKQNAQGQWVENVIEGLSIRFAEVAVRCMTNMQPDSQTIYEDDTSRIVRVTVTDYESNVTWSKDLSIRKTVERRQLKKGQRPLGERLNSYGDRVFIVEATDDEVATKEAALLSKASRTLILRAVPGHIQDEAKALCKAIATDRTAKNPAAARNAMFDAFSSIGVKPSALEQFIGHATDTLSPAEVEELRGLFAAIREGEISWAEALKERTESRDAEREQPPAPKPPQTQPAPAPAPRQSEPPPAAPEPQRETPAVKPRQSSGRGTAALKGALKNNGAKPEPPPATIPRPQEDDDGDPEAEPGWMGRPEVPPGTPPPRDGFEDRGCAKCGALIEVEIGTPAGSVCYACSQA